MRLSEEPESPRQINIVPMIDVIFAILTFLIISSVSLTRFDGLPVNLPNATTGEMQPPAQIMVTIDAQGRLYIDRQPIDATQLSETLRANVSPNTPLLLVINADKSVSHGQVVSVMDLARAIPGVRLAIATQRP